MTFQDYQDLFDDILAGKIAATPYDDVHFVEYTKLNQSRQNRWLKKGTIDEKLKNVIAKLNTKQHWTLITEPWCGDASHSVPFIAMLANLNQCINLEIQLRDSENSEIGHYLTNGSKSIPILIVRDVDGKDIFRWGPRPAKCQQVFDDLRSKEVAFDELKKGLQEWYNHDRGMNLQQELLALFNNL